MFLFVCIPIDARQKRILQTLVIVGGVVVHSMRSPNTFRGGNERKLNEQAVLHRQGWAVELSGTKLLPRGNLRTDGLRHGLAMSEYARNLAWRFPLFALAVFVSWPALACGSRSGLFMTIFVFIGAVVFFRECEYGFLYWESLGFVITAAGVASCHRLIRSLRSPSR